MDPTYIDGWVTDDPLARIRAARIRSSLTDAFNKLNL